MARWSRRIPKCQARYAPLSSAQPIMTGTYHVDHGSPTRWTVALPMKMDTTNSPAPTTVKCHVSAEMKVADLTA